VSIQSALPVVRYVAIEHVTPVQHDQATLSMTKFLEVLARMWQPCSLRFEACADGRGGLAGGWVVAGEDAPEVEQVAADVWSALSAICPWLGLAAPTARVPWGNLGASTHVLRPRPRRSQHQVVSATPAGWTAALMLAEPVGLSVNLASVNRPREVVSVGPARSEEDPEAGSTTVLGSVAVHAIGQRRAVMAALFAEDAPFGFEFVAEPIRPGRATPIDDVPARLVAHLLSAPLRLRRAFPERPVVRSDQLFDFIGSTPTPHTLVVGASGEGKSCFLGNLADAACLNGEQVIAVDVADSEFADSVVRSARRHGDEPLDIDFGDEERRWTLQMTRPPLGVSGERWADDLYDLISSVLWSDLPAEYFGPVASRVSRLILTALIRDPDGPASLTQIPRLIDVVDPSYRNALLARIGDEDLTRGFHREVLPMLSAKEAGNSATWVVSKFEPLMGASSAEILCGKRETVAIDAALASGRSIVLRAPASVLGDSASRVVVAIMLHRIWLALRRNGTAAARVNLLVDEWQRYATPTLSTMLAEGRKYSLRLVLANQNLAQLTPKVRDGVLGNVGALVCFRTGPTDAGVLSEMFPESTRGDLLSLRPHHVAILAGGREMRAVAPAPLVPVVAGSQGELEVPSPGDQRPGRSTEQTCAAGDSAPPKRA
jgi:hypothetical protein